MSKNKFDSFKFQFRLLSNIDKGDYFIYDKLTNQEKKVFSEFMTMKWMTGTNDSRQIIFVNEFINSILFGINNHPSLLLKLMACSSSKQGKRYKYKGLKKKVKESNKIQILKQYYDYSTKEAKQYIKLIDDNEIILMAQELGYQDKDIKNLKRKLK